DAPVIKSRACDLPVRTMTSRSCGGVALAGPRRATSDPSSCRSTRHSTSSPPRASSGSGLNLQSVTICANSSLAPTAVIHVCTALAVGQVVRGLDNEHLEHHHGVERRASALLAIGIGQRRIEGGTEQLEV